jgi:hypothetical protein
MRFSPGSFLALGVFGLVLTAPCQADPIYSYVFGQRNYTIAPGGTVAVQVFLQEDDGAGGSAFLQSVGLIGAGVRVNFDDPAPSQRAQVASLSDIHPNPEFLIDMTSNFVPLFTPGVSAGLTENVGLGDPVTASGSGPIYRILIGDFVFTAGSIPGEVTHLTAMRTGSDSGDNVGADFPATVLDDLIQDSSATITVQSSTAVPVPASGVLGAMGAGVLVVFRWYQRRRTARVPRRPHASDPAASTGKASAECPLQHAGE